MALFTTHSVKCDKCGKTLSVEGKGASRGSLYKKAVSANWQWKSAKSQLCPEHRSGSSEKKAKPAKKVTKKSVSKPKKVSAGGIPPAPAEGAMG